MSAPSSRARASSLSGGSTSHGNGRERRHATAAAAPEPLSGSSAASSQIVTGGGTQPSRADQIVYRFYLKTVGVLVDGRVTHFNKGEGKKDRWFNISIPDTEVHKADLSIYRLVSAYPPLPQPPPGESASRSTVPPLLIAFILDTNDIPAGQTVMWNRDGQRVALDPCLVQPPAPGARRPGIILERWTFRVTDVATNISAGSDMAPPTAYRLGIVHFRALYAFIRLLPAYRLFRRLRRLNTGLRLGIKLWGPEGYANTEEGLADAWEVMERDLVGIDVPLESMVPPQADSPSTNASEPLGEYNFAPLELFGNTYELGAVYRPNVDFEVEDMESVLSERFVDMDEEWFTPTVARHRLQAEARAAASAGTTRSVSRATNPPTTSSTPPVLQPGITGTSATRQLSTTPSRTGSTPNQPSSLGAGKWTALGEGLPFASGISTATGATGSGGDSGSPIALSPTVATASAIPYRRLSAHSLQPFRSISASPSTSILRGPGSTQFAPGVSPATRTAMPAPSPHLPGSVPRTSEFLSSSGRSFSHAQMANIIGQHGHGSPNPTSPITGGPGDSPPFAPSSLSFTKQAVRQPPMAHSVSSPFIPSSLDRESALSQNPGSLPKRYSSSIVGRRLPGSAGSSVDRDMPASLLRRQSSTRESGLRHSIDEPHPEAPDKDDVHAFLRALDSWTPPASIAPHSLSPRNTTSALSSASAAPPTQGSTASSNSASVRPSSHVSSASGSGAPGSGSMLRTPLTRQHVDDMLKRMAGSFSAGTEQTSVHSTSRPSSFATRRDSNTSDRSAATGLLSASRPSPPHMGISPRSNASPLPGSSLRHGSLPRSGALPFAAPPHLTSNTGAGAARSLPSTRDDGGDAPGPLRAFSPPDALSPQTTGGTDASRRRGPVLVRGGFGAASKASTTASSPSHSPVRYRSILTNDHREPHDPGSTFNSGAPIRRAATVGSTTVGNNRVGRTAPSSLGADLPEDSESGVARIGRARASEGTSPSRSLAERIPVEGLMARLALAEQRDERDE